MAVTYTPHTGWLMSNGNVSHGLGGRKSETRWQPGSGEGSALGHRLEPSGCALRGRRVDRGQLSLMTLRRTLTSFM